MSRLKDRFGKRRKLATQHGVASGQGRHVSAIATVLLLEVGGALAFCQLAFFPITIGAAGLRFHSFLYFLPFAAAAAYVSLPVCLCCAAAIAALLCLRIQFMPMDYYELLFSNPIGAIMTSCLFALAIWLIVRGTSRLCSRRLGKKFRIPALAVALLVASTAISTVWLVYLQAVFSAYGYGDYVTALAGGLWTGDFWCQVVFDWLAWLAGALVSNALTGRILSSRVEPPMRTVFRRWLSMVIVGAFLLTTSINFLFSTVQALGEAKDALGGQASYVCSQVEERVRQQQDVAGLVDSYAGGFGSAVAIMRDGEIVSSNDPELTLAFGSAEDYQNSFTDELSFLQDEKTLGILYSYAVRTGDYGVFALASSEQVFANRTAIIVGNTLCYLVLFGAVFALVSSLLNNLVVKGFNRTNDTLSLITSGDLEQRVEEHETQEFSALSDGINTTVDALKDLIDEAERRMERDLATAKAIQESALPRTFPPFPEIDAFDIYASMDPAREVGGDFFDFFLIDERTLGFLIADVSGKGIPGALFMMAAKAELESFMLAGGDLAQAVSSANKVLCANNDAGMFVTVWAATLDWETGRLTYVNAGHNFPLLRRGRGGEWEWMQKKCGLFLGTFDTARYRQETIELEPGDELVLYTDGVNEAFSVDEEEFGNDRLEAFLVRHADCRPRELVGDLRAEVAAWAKGAEQSDDITILALEL